MAKTTHLHGGEGASTRACVGDADVHQGLEGAVLALLLDLEKTLEIVAGHVRLSLVVVSQANLGEVTAGQEQASGVAAGVVGQAALNAVTGQLGRVGAAKHLITLHLGLDDLACDPQVGNAHHESVLGSAVLVAVLGHHLPASPVVGLALTTPPELGLVALVVSLGLE
jgi:hypothetical protein